MTTIPAPLSATAAPRVAGRTVLEAVELGILVGLAFSLPLFEAPKNILWGAFVVIWLFNRVRARDFGGPWDGWDTLILAWIVSAWLAAPFAGLHAKEWLGPVDLMRYTSLLWLVRRSRFTPRELAWVLGAVVLATLIALVHGYWRVWAAPAVKPKALELRSVGHVNHSAIYLAIVAGGALAAALAWWDRMSAAMRVLAAGSALFLCASVVVSASRGAIGVLAVLCLFISLAWWPRSRWPAYLVAATLAIGAAGAIGLRVEVVRKQQANTERGNVLAYRDKVWNAALAAVERYPCFGVGVDNYPQISLERIEQWQKEAGKPYVADAYGGTSHAHSLYFNTLAERGIVGFAALMAVLVAWAIGLVRGYPGRSGDAIAWTLWGGALSAWFVSVGVGTVNTTLHHEHALLSMLLLGLWLSWRRYGVATRGA